MNNIAVYMMSIPNLPIFKTPCIIMGVDNAAPAQGEGSRPSVCALVGSVDKYACWYATQIVIQMTDGKKAHSPIIEKYSPWSRTCLLSFTKRSKLNRSV